MVVSICKEKEKCFGEEVVEIGPPDKFVELQQSASPNGESHEN
jgi:hypothetical protein